MGLFSRVKDAQQQASQAMAGAGGMKGMMGGGDISAQVAHARLVNKLRDSGVEAPGVIGALRPTGATAFGGGQKTEVDATITRADGQAYQTTITQSFLPAQLETLSAGTSIKVKYDPDNPSAAIIYGWA
jgi:hypothetical protein